MTSAAKKLRRAKGKSRAKRRRVVLMAGCFGVALLLAGLGLYRGLGTASSKRPAAMLIPQPPAVDLAGADPTVAKVVSATRAAVCESPSSAAAWGKLGMVLFVHSFPGEAEVCFAQAGRLDMRQARWPYFRGIILGESDPEAAIQEFQRAADLCADVADAPRLRLGEMLLGQGRLREAQEHFQRVLQRDPANVRAELGLGRLAFLKGDLEESERHLVRPVADHRTRKAARILLAQTRERIGKKLTAEEYRLTASLPDDPDWPDPFVDEAEKLQTGKHALLTRANVLLEKGRVTESIALCRQLARDYPDSETAWLILGRALVQQKDLPAAQEALQKVLRLEPESVEAHFYLGFATYLRRDYRAAATWYRKATELKPDFTFAYHDLGQCLILLGDRGGAIDAFRKALCCQPDIADVHRLLGELLDKDGQRGEAFVHARITLQLNPTDAAAKKLLQRLFVQIPIPTGP